MKTRVQELIQRGDTLFTKRFPMMTLWQTFAENFDPMHADFTRARFMSEEFSSYLMTGRPVLAHRELSNAISSILRPRGMPWHKASTGNPAIDKDNASASWLAMSDGVMGGIFADRKSQFGRATKEGDAFYTLTGQAVIEPRINALRNGMLYRCWHLRDCVWSEDAELVITNFHRKWKPEAQQLCDLARKSGWTTLHPDVTKKAEKDPSVGIDCRAIVMPADDYDSFGKDEEGYSRKRNPNFPFVSVVIDTEHNSILEETPQRKLGYVIPRWVTIGGFSQYAYSPCAVVALPEGRMMQQMTMMMLEIGAKVLDPPMAAVGDAIQGGVNLMSGAITWIDPDYDERTGEALRPIEFHPEGLQWGIDREKQIAETIAEAFYLNVLNLPTYDQKEMTAEEFRGRMGEYIRRATPLFDPMRGEYNGALCDDTFDTLLHMGKFGSPYDMPPALRGASVEFKFRDPLVQAEEEQTTDSFRKLAGLLGQALALDPSLKADVDTDTAFRDAVPGTGAKPEWLRPKDEADAIKTQNRQQEQQVRQADLMGHVGDSAGKVAAALKTGGEAASALQDSGAV